MKITKLACLKALGLAAVLGTAAVGSCAADLNRAWPLFPRGIHYSHDLGMAFDLGVSNYIGPVAQATQNEQLSIGIDSLKSQWLDVNDHSKGTLYDNIPDKNAYLNKQWSYDNAIYLTGLLPATQKNDQVSALRDALSLYAVVRSGTWNGLNIASDKNAAEEAQIRTALFGDGARQGALISQILIGTSAANSYPNIHEVLTRLGISNANDLQHHFHIYLNPPKATPIIGTGNLLVNESSESLEATSTPDATLQLDAQGLLDYTETITNTGEELMFIMDVPYVPAEQVSVVLAQAAAAGATPTPDYILQQCQETESSGDSRSAMRGVDPAGWLAVYLGNRDRRDIYGNHAAMASIKTTMLEGTKHGNIFAEVDSEGLVSYHYDPTPGYVGKDRAVFMAEFQGKRYKIVIDLVVSLVVNENEPVCPPPKLIKVNGKPVSDSSAYQLNSFTITFRDLPGGAVGQTSGTEITLDLTAAGHGWYVDPTPLDNSDDYLPTSNPDVWQAKAGTDAAGKMDLLSVLLHEYGHALGLEHSADSGDYMAATLQPGQRRLPSADELQLMSQLVAELKGSNSQSPHPSPLPGGEGGLPLGALLLGRLALGRRPEDAVFDGSQALFAAHPTLQGGSLQNLQDWATQGQVTVASGGAGGATLQEGAASQTRLNQIFTINERDRFLSFTLAGTALDDVNGAPDDAFEVALLEANTGRSLTGALSLGHTDALLNLQANGTETTASNVTRVTNADGSRTYRVDLSGIAAGTAVNLSFDLIGFGQNTSQITVRDVRVSGLPELHDDVASLAEDGALAFDPFAQVDNAALLALGSHVVDAPAHGSVTLNADGTFVYTPAQDYFGADSLTQATCSNTLYLKP